MVKKEAIEAFLARKLENYDWIKDVELEELDEAIEELGYKSNLGLTPRKHQKASFYLCANTNSFLLHLDMGTGKTYISVMLYDFFKSHERTVKKMLAVVPNTVNIKNWEEQVLDFSPYKPIMLYGTFTERQKLLKEEGDIYIINYEGLQVMMASLQNVKGKKNKKRVYDATLAKEFVNKFDMVVLDEIHKCFHSSTTVLLKDSEKLISEVKKGETLKTLTGEFKPIKDIFINKILLNNICKVVFSDFEIVCSLDHLFFTNKGWIKAIDLKNELVFLSNVHYNDAIINKECLDEKTTNRKKLPVLWKTFYNRIITRTSKIKRTKILWNVLFSKMEKQTAKRYSGQFFTRSKIESETWNSKFLERKLRSIKSCCSDSFRSNEKIESYAHRRRERKSTENSGLKWITSHMARNSGWKWFLFKRTINNFWIIIRNRSKMDFRISSKNWMCTSKRWSWISNKLQSRYWKSKFKIRNRVRWWNSSSESYSIKRQEKRGEIKRIRVENIEIYQQGSNDGSFSSYISDNDRSNGYCEFYDLEIEGHPSYYANKILVHNCKNSQSLTFQLCKEICAKTPIRYGLTGTPLSRDSQDLWSQFFLIDRGETFGHTISLFRQAFYSTKPGYFGGMDYILDKKKESILQSFIKNKSIYYADHECGDLPKQIFIKRYVNMSVQGQKEMTLLRQIAKEQAKEQRENPDSGTRRESIYNKGRQISSGFIYEKLADGEKLGLRFGDNPKLDELEELLEDMPQDQKIVIFYHFEESGNMIKERMKKLKINFNAGGGKNTITEYEAFKKNKKSRAFVINISSGSTGLNLQNAAYCLYYEPTDNVIEYRQSLKRIHREGQKSNRVYYYFFITEHSVEERIYEYLQEGIDISSKLIEGKISLVDLL